MIYLGLLVIMGVWAFIGWKGRPLRHFVRIYFVGCMLTALSEPLLIRLLRAYELNMWLLPDRESDFALTSIVVGLLLDPLLGVVYARYCRRRPILIALMAGLLLGALEWYMVMTGSVTYLRPWSPLITTAFFFGFFLMIWWTATHLERIPVWVDTYGIAAFWTYGTDLFLQGVLRLWEYQAVWSDNRWEDTRTLSDLLMSFAICPLVTVIATAPLRHRWVWAAAAGISLWLLELAAWSSGMIAMDRLTAWLEVFRRLALVSIVTLYAGWMRRSAKSA